MSGSEYGSCAFLLRAALVGVNRGVGLLRKVLDVITDVTVCAGFDLSLISPHVG